MDALSERLRLGPIEVDVAALPFGGENECGDDFCAVERPDGVLLAAVDGLGHGPQAAAAARLARASFTGAPAGTPLVQLLERGHGDLKHSRGAAVCAAFLRHGAATLEWLAVGNVDGILVRAGGAARDAVVQRPGIVGRALPPLRASTVPIAAGDVLVMVSDGIEPGFRSELGGDRLPDAEGILNRFATHADDALVLVARYLGDRS